MAFNQDPYKTNQFWVKLVDEKLENRFITPSYRKRLEAIKADAMARIGKEGTTAGHYPRQRRQ